MGSEMVPDKAGGTTEALNAVPRGVNVDAEWVIV